MDCAIQSGGLISDAPDTANMTLTVVGMVASSSAGSFCQGNVRIQNDLLRSADFSLLATHMHVV